MIDSHLPVLQVAVPLLGAPLCMIGHCPVRAWVVTQLTTACAFLISCALLLKVWSDGTILYALGGWAAPWGIEYRLDALNTPLLVLVSGLGALMALYARRSAALEIAADRLYLFYIVYLLNLVGLLGVICTGDVFNLFVFIEIASLSSCTLVSLNRDPLALPAAFRYLILGTLGATFILIGIGYLYALTGTLNMADLAKLLPQVQQTRTAAMAYAFITIGLALKFAMFPLHAWLPPVYTRAPSVIAALFAATTTKVFLYVWLRMTFFVFGIDYLFGQLRLDTVLLVLASLGILAGSLTAVFQYNFRRMLAYSSIAQVGYMMLGMVLATSSGLSAGLLYLFNHALIKGALFLAAGCFAWHTGAVSLRQLQGIGRRMPWSAAALMIGAAGLVGVPLSAGFVSKWYLVQAVLEQQWWLVLPILIGSLLSLVYMWRVAEVLWQEPADGETGYREAPRLMLVPLWTLALAVIWFGIDSTLPTALAARAAEQMLAW